MERHDGFASGIVKTKDLPKGIRAALAEFGFKKREVRVRASETGTMYNPGGEGERGVFVMGKADGQIGKVVRGNFGGFTIGSNHSPVDNDHSEIAIPSGGFIVNGTEGGRGPTARVTVNPDVYEKHFQGKIHEETMGQLLSRIEEAADTYGVKFGQKTGVVDHTFRKGGNKTPGVSVPHKAQHSHVKRVRKHTNGKI